jgi:hypothetical protein
VVGSLKAKSATDLKMVTGNTNLITLNKAIPVLVLAVSNCRHALRKALTQGQLTLPRGITVPQVNNVSSSDDSCSDFRSRLTKLMAKETADEKAKKDLDKVLWCYKI